MSVNRVMDRCDQDEPRTVRKVVVWPADSLCSPARLAGRVAARQGISDDKNNRPFTNITEWLVGHYEAKRRLRERFGE